MLDELLLDELLLENIEYTQAAESPLRNFKLGRLARRTRGLHGRFLVVRVDGQGAVILDRPGCVGFEVAPRIEAQAPISSQRAQTT